jgi:DNA-binding LacI/PurR family transcriptional regulator
VKGDPINSQCSPCALWWILLHLTGHLDKIPGVVYTATGCKRVKQMSEKKVHTIKDIARLAGVSKSTVSRALSDSPLICSETKERIQGIAKEHNFQIDVRAQRLSTGQSNTIGFVTHAYHQMFTVADLFAVEILGGISEGLTQNHYDLLMVYVDPYVNGWAEGYFNTGKVDGFILMTSSRKQQHIKSLLNKGAPFIAWGAPSAKASYCTVCGDDYQGGLLATQHLVGLGRCKIAFLGGPEEELEVQHRYEGYVDVLKEAGLAPDPSRVAYGNFSNTSGADAMHRLLDQAPDLDAVFVNGDLMAIEAMKVLQQAGRRIPDDVAVVGYDNLSITEQVSPTLTTVSQNIHLAGRLLAKNLLQYIQTRAVTHVTVPVELMVRQSA